MYEWACQGVFRWDKNLSGLGHLESAYFRVAGACVHKSVFEVWIDCVGERGIYFVL